MKCRLIIKIRILKVSDAIAKQAILGSNVHSFDIGLMQKIGDSGNFENSCRSGSFPPIINLDAEGSPYNNLIPPDLDLDGFPLCLKLKGLLLGSFLKCPDLQALHDKQIAAIGHNLSLVND